MGQITTTQNLVAIKEVRHAGQQAVVLRLDVRRNRTTSSSRLGNLVISIYTMYYQGGPPCNVRTLLCTQLKAFYKSTKTKQSKAIC